MKRILFLLSVMLMALSTACRAASTPTPTVTSTPETAEAAVTPTMPPTWTPTPIPTPAPTSAPTSSPTPAATPTPVPNDVWVDAVNGLNLRAEAKADAKLVATLKHQQHLVAIGSPVGPDASGVTWQNVRTDDGQTGWVSAQFLTKTNPTGPTPTPPPAAASAPTATPAALSGEAWVNSADGLNLRAQAVTTATVVALLPFGTHVTLTGAPSGPDAGGTTWQSVRTDDNKSGYVSAQFLSATKPATPTAPITTTTSATTTVPLGAVWVISTNGLNLRAQPSSTASVVAMLAYGQRLTALAPKTAPDAGGVAWQNVRTEANQAGWAAAEFLATTPPATATVTTTTSSSTQIAGELLGRLNALRIQNGESLLTSNAQLTAAAQRHSQDMAQTGIVSHTGSDGSTAPQRIAAAGYAGQHGDEVIAGGQVTLDDVWNGWLSTRQDANVLLNSIYTDVGIAVVNAGDKSYYTITVGGP